MKADAKSLLKTLTDDLNARITALEEKVAALEERMNRNI